jgi:toxin ParE1/3/4
VAAYQLTRAASKDIEALFIEGLVLFGLSAADKYHDGLTSTLEFLADFPCAARVRAELDPPVRAFRYKSHMVIYEPAEDDTVIVLQVRHGHEDWIPYSDERDS